VEVYWLRESVEGKKGKGGERRKVERNEGFITGKFVLASLKFVCF
jgi:hypothetical protein